MQFVLLKFKRFWELKDVAKFQYLLIKNIFFVISHSVGCYLLKQRQKCVSFSEYPILIYSFIGDAIRITLGNKIFFIFFVTRTKVGKPSSIFFFALNSNVLLVFFFYQARFLSDARLKFEENLFHHITDSICIN